MPRWRVLVIGVCIALVTAACGSSDDDESSDAEAPASPTTTTGPTTSAGPTTIPASAPTTAAPAAPAGDAGQTLLPDAVGMDLQAAQDTMQAAGFYYLTSHDATGQGRNQVLDRNWSVCVQTPAGGSPQDAGVTIDFGAVKDDETCP